MKDFSYITGSSPEFVEKLYHDFVKNPGSIDPEFRKFFEGFEFALSIGAINGQSKTGNAPVHKLADLPQLTKEFAVYNLILAYRKKGHLAADTNPIRPRRDRGANLDLSYFGLDETDLTNEFEAASFARLKKTTLQHLIVHLKKCYTHHVGIEYNSLINEKKIEWLEKEIETTLLRPLSLEQRRRILEKLRRQPKGTRPGW